jgi:hypothetical protein
MDNSPAPFQFKPLVGDIPADAVDHTLYSMADMLDTMPTGSLAIEQVEEDGLPFTSFTLLFFALISSVLVINQVRRRNT